MKTLLCILMLICLSCAKPVDVETEKAAITKLIDDETAYAAAVDSINWATCWANTDEAQFTIATADGVQQFTGWSNIKAGLKDLKPFELKIRREHYNYAVGNDLAFITFDQTDNWGGAERSTKESRTLKKFDGLWKIVNANVLVSSSFEKQPTASWHILKENVPVGMKAGKMIMRSAGNLGGMVVAFNEVPAGTDIAPLMKGLPNDACPAPHWGYLLEGSIRIRYIDGKEETVKAGEIFYWPAGHVALVEKDLKIIDFSPEAETAILMDHIDKKMKEASTKK